MNEILVDLFRHNLWANQRLLETCAELDEAQLNAADPGAYGTIAATLAHLAGAEQRYLNRFTAQEPETPVREAEGFPGCAALLQALRASGAGLIEVARTAQPGQVLHTHFRGRPMDLRVETLLIQVINHATEHRTNVTTILAQQGVEPPGLDGWSFAGDL